MPDIPPPLPPRPAESHKGTYGRALLLGGSRGMPGSISLAGMAALASGAGLVTIATAASCQPVVAGFEPAYTTLPLPEDAAGRIAYHARFSVAEILQDCRAAGIGPGLGQGNAQRHLIAWLHAAAPLPLVLDADALNCLAKRPALAEHAGPRILTPHPGEFRRLMGNAESPSEEWIRRAEGLARRWNVVLVLKGHRTLVTDGSRSVRNPTGNPGMATGGTGDVLTGVITALLAQGLPPFEAAQLGVYVHGAAGDLAAAALGQTSLTATDLLDFLPAAFRRFEGTGHSPS